MRHHDPIVLLLASTLMIGLLPAQAAETGGSAATPPVQVEEHEMDLDWDPSISMGDLIRGMPRLPSTVVTVRRFRDIRPRTELVADMKESQTRVHHFITEDSVGEWVTNNFSRSLGKAGVRIGSGGEIVISGEIVNFLATKSPDYNGDVAIRINIERGGKTLWRGTVSGWAHESDSGGIGDEDDYNEVLSDAIVRAAASLAWYPKFRAALQGRPMDEDGEGDKKSPGDAGA